MLEGVGLHALDFEAAKLMNRLRRQSKMAHDRHSGFDDVADCFFGAVNTLDLYRLSPSTHDLRYFVERSIETSAVREKRHVADDELSRSAFPNRLNMQRN